MLILASCRSEKAAGVAEISAIPAEQTYSRVCATCHGEDGYGKPELSSPPIAGLPSWYVEEQIGKFRKGWRGAKPEDLPGLQMRAIAMSLSDEQIIAASELVEKMPSYTPPVESPEEMLNRGRYLYANQCMACHRYNGSGEIVFRSAPLTGLSATYIERQLRNYQSELRGYHKSDISGQKMVDACRHLSDQEISALASYITALANGDDPRPAMEK